jgi:hypothetical protein
MSQRCEQATSQVYYDIEEIGNCGGLAMQAERSVMNLSRYLAKNTPPEKRAILRAAAAVIIAYTLGVFVIFLLF